MMSYINLLFTYLLTNYYKDSPVLDV